MENKTQQYNEAAELLKLLAHPIRLCIVKGLMDQGECNVTHMQSCLGAPQSTVSQHIQKLKSAGIIEGRRSGLEIYYSIKNKKVEDLVRVLFPMLKGELI